MRNIKHSLLLLFLIGAVLICHSATTIALFGSKISLNQIPLAAEEENTEHSEDFKFSDDKNFNQTFTIASGIAEISSLFFNSESLLPTIYLRTFTPPPDWHFTC